MIQKVKPHLLMILDGWGVRSSAQNNAVKIARTPVLDNLLMTRPHTLLRCSGEAVGLPPGVMGNSEVGHMNIGAGRVVYQDLLRINQAIAEGTFDDTAAFNRVMDQVDQSNGALHLMGLLSDGGVHSHIDHLKALVLMAQKKGLQTVRIHVILDGRDTPPKSGVDYVRQLSEFLDQTGLGTIATICGRFYAMDRDTRWERIEKAYGLYTKGQGVLATDPVKAVVDAYSRGQTDEFVEPIIIGSVKNEHAGPISNGDGIISFNFRADRAREITRAFTDPDFSFFKREPYPKLSGYVCMTLYDEAFTLPIGFPPVHLTGIMGEVISEQDLYQLRIAETEKYAHVTYFFNGGEEKPFNKEERCLIPSPRHVTTYDEQPSMSAPEVTREVLERLNRDRYSFIVLNYANMDMVGHTGKLPAAVEACEVVDRCLGKIVDRVLELKGTVIITADHGNSESMVDENGQPHTAHTTNPVRLVLVDDDLKSASLEEGGLADISPTMLDIMGILQPDQMTGRSLIHKR